MIAFVVIGSAMLLLLLVSALLVIAIPGTAMLAGKNLCRPDKRIDHQESGRHHALSFNNFTKTRTRPASSCLIFGMDCQPVRSPALLPAGRDIELKKSK